MSTVWAEHAHVMRGNPICCWFNSLFSIFPACPSKIPFFLKHQKTCQSKMTARELMIAAAADIQWAVAINVRRNVFFGNKLTSSISNKPEFLLKNVLFSLSALFACQSQWRWNLETLLMLLHGAFRRKAFSKRHSSLLICKRQASTMVLVRHQRLSRIYVIIHNSKPRKGEKHNSTSMAKVKYLSL